MKKILPVIGIVLLCLVIVLVICLRKRPDNITKSVEEAGRFLKSAKKAEKRSYSEALGLYEKALRKLEKAGAELSMDVLPTLKAKAEGDLRACALLAARRVEGADQRAAGMAGAADLYARSGDTQRAEEILSAAVQTLRGEGDPSSGYLMVFTLTMSIAESYVKMGQNGIAAKIAAEALEKARAIRDQQSRDLAMICVSRSFAAAGEFEQALELARSLEDSYHKASALADIARQYAEDGKKNELDKLSGEIVRLAEAISNPHWKSSTLASLAKSYVQLDEFDQALRLTEMINDPSEKAQTLVDIATKQGKAEQKERALECFSQAATVARAIPDPEGKIEKLTRIAEAYLELDETGLASELVRESLEVAETMTELDDKAQALTGIAFWCHELGEKEKCSTLLSRALETAREVEGTFDRGWTFAHVAGALASVGQSDEAFRVAGIVISEDSDWDLAMMVISDCHIDRERPLEALRAIERIGDINMKVGPLHNLARSYVEKPWEISEAEKRIMREIARDLDVQR